MADRRILFMEKNWAFNRGMICVCSTLGSRDITALVNKALITVVYPGVNVCNNTIKFQRQGMPRGNQPVLNSSTCLE